MANYLERRLKRVDISVELAPDKYTMIAMFRELPADAKLVRFGESLPGGTMTMLFYSKEWPVIGDWEQIPVLHITVDRELVAAAEFPDPGEMQTYGKALALRHMAGRTRSSRIQSKVPNHGVEPQDGCTCDVAYTGAHRHECKFPRR